jgi:hypothetical protein
MNVLDSDTLFLGFNIYSVDKVIVNSKAMEAAVLSISGLRRGLDEDSMETSRP